MKDIMLADTPVEQRAQILRDSCDQIVERSYTRTNSTKKKSTKGGQTSLTWRFKRRIWNNH